MNNSYEDASSKGGVLSVLLVVMLSALSAVAEAEAALFAYERSKSLEALKVSALGDAIPTTTKAARQARTVE